MASSDKFDFSNKETTYERCKSIASQEIDEMVDPSDAVMIMIRATAQGEINIEKKLEDGKSILDVASQNWSKEASNYLEGISYYRGIMEYMFSEQGVKEGLTDDDKVQEVKEAFNLQVSGLIKYANNIKYNSTEIS